MMLLALLLAQASAVPKGHVIDATTKANSMRASVRRQPLASYFSCDGKMKIDTSAWQYPGGGFFVTVWRRTSRGSWKSEYEFSNALVAPRPLSNRPLVRKAACPAKSIALRQIGYRHGSSDDVSSPDGTLQYHWWEPGFDFSVEIWDGKDFVRVIEQRIPPGLQ